MNHFYMINKEYTPSSLGVFLYARSVSNRNEYIAGSELFPTLNHINSQDAMDHL